MDSIKESLQFISYEFPKEFWGIEIRRMFFLCGVQANRMRRSKVVLDELYAQPSNEVSNGTECPEYVMLLTRDRQTTIAHNE